ncbi:hypothetical protein C8J57DRAFT_1246654 [Mycena rebaudengoi]|nr:hypothetical protein C8J57DRAFT_1246654 [Mycena rebaudengoi]
MLVAGIKGVPKTTSNQMIHSVARVLCGAVLRQHYPHMARLTGVSCQYSVQIDPVNVLATLPVHTSTASAVAQKDFFPALHLCTKFGSLCLTIRRLSVMYTVKTGQLLLLSFSGLKMIVPHFPFFRPKDDEAICAVVGKCTTYSWYNSKSWVTTNLPQSVKADSVLCLRALGITRCPGGPFTTSRKRALSPPAFDDSPSPNRIRRCISPVDPVDTIFIKKELLLSRQGDIIDLTSGDDINLSSMDKTKPWPLKYACDMVSGLELMGTIPGRRQNAFNVVFPDCIWKSSTYYDHLGVWKNTPSVLLNEFNLQINMFGPSPVIRTSLFCHLLLPVLNFHHLVQCWSQQVLKNGLSVQDINAITQKFIGSRQLTPCPKIPAECIALLIEKGVKVDWVSVASADWVPAASEIDDDVVTKYPAPPTSSPLSSPPSPPLEPPDRPPPVPPPSNNPDLGGEDQHLGSGRGAFDLVAFQKDYPGFCIPGHAPPEFTTLKIGPNEDGLWNVHWSFSVHDPHLDSPLDANDKELDLTRLIVADFTDEKNYIQITRFNWIEVVTRRYVTHGTLSADSVPLVQALFDSRWEPASANPFEIYWALAGYPDIPARPLARFSHGWELDTVEWLNGVDTEDIIPVIGQAYARRLLLVVKSYSPLEVLNKQLKTPKDEAIAGWLADVLQGNQIVADIKGTKKGQPVHVLVDWMQFISKTADDHRHVPHMVADRFAEASNRHINNIHIGHVVRRDSNWISEARSANSTRKRLTKKFKEIGGEGKLALLTYLSSETIAGMPSFARHLKELERKYVVAVPEPASLDDE